jgi:hypothetical protein
VRDLAVNLSDELSRLEALSVPAPWFLSRYREMDAQLVQAGFPATSPWWLETFGELYTRRKRTLVARVGRQGGKSTTLCRLGVAEALYGGHVIPHGTLATVAFVSVDRKEATDRLLTVQKILLALGVAWVPLEGGRGIRLVDKPITFRVYTASISGVSGGTCIFACCDEVAKWRDLRTGVNPATEVLASLRPALVTMPRAKLVLISSPLGRLDLHAKEYERGETATQMTAYAPTWVANPSVTEEWTRGEEANEGRWKREFLAVPLEEGEEGLLTALLLDRSTRTEMVVARAPLHSYVAAMDPATRGDAWTLVVATLRWVGGRLKRSIVCAKEYHGTSSQPLDPAAVLRDIASELAAYGLTSVYSDQASADALRRIGQDVGLSVVIAPSTAQNKITRYESLETWMGNGEVELPPDPQVRADLLSVTKKLTPNGFTIVLPRVGDRHADYAPAITLALSRSVAAPPEPTPERTVAERNALERARIDATAEAHLRKIYEGNARTKRENVRQEEDLWGGLGL